MGDLKCIYKYIIKKTNIIIISDKSQAHQPPQVPTSNANHIRNIILTIIIKKQQKKIRNKIY